MNPAAAAFEELRKSIMSKVNQYLTQAKPFDWNKSMQNLRLHHRFFFHLGCLRHDQSRTEQELLAALANELNDGVLDD